jgi:Protein CHAPERONE-LIKE PROTEIN OF POR1-like
VQQPKRASRTATQTLIPQLPGGGSVTISTPAASAAATTSIVFASLAAWTLAQGLMEPNPGAAAVDVPGLQIALGVAACVYLLRENKRAGLGKAAGLALGGLVAGTLVGGLIESWLRVDIVPIGALASPGILVGEFSLAGLWAACFFLA